MRAWWQERKCLRGVENVVSWRSCKYFGHDIYTVRDLFLKTWSLNPGYLENKTTLSYYYMHIHLLDYFYFLLFPNLSLITQFTEDPGLPCPLVLYRPWEPQVCFSWSLFGREETSLYWRDRNFYGSSSTSLIHSSSKGDFDLHIPLGVRNTEWYPWKRPVPFCKEGYESQIPMSVGTEDGENSEEVNRTWSCKGLPFIVG